MFPKLQGKFLQAKARQSERDAESKIWARDIFGVPQRQEGEHRSLGKKYLMMTLRFAALGSY